MEPILNDSVVLDVIRAEASLQAPFGSLRKRREREEKQKKTGGDTSIIMDLSPKMFMELPGLVKYHYKEGNFNWPMIIYISLVHYAAAVGVAKITQCSTETLMWAFLLWPIRYVLKLAKQ